MSEYAFGTVSWLELVVILACAIILSVCISREKNPVKNREDFFEKAQDIIDKYFNSDPKFIAAIEKSIAESEDGFADDYFTRAMVDKIKLMLGHQVDIIMSYDLYFQVKDKYITVKSMSDVVKKVQKNDEDNL